MALPLGSVLTAGPTFTVDGVPTTPSPAPTVTAARYPNQTALTPLPSVGSPVSAGSYEIDVFTANLTLVLSGTYEAWIHTTDTTVDEQTIHWVWEDVGINSVSAFATAALASIFNYLAASVTTEGSWAKYVYDTLAAILSRTASNVTFTSPVAQDGLTTTLYIARDYLVTNGQQLDYGIDDLAADDVITWSVARPGSTPLEVTGTYVLVGSQPTARVEVTAAQTATLGGYIGTQVLEILITNAVGDKSERLVGRAVVRNVNVLTPS